MSSVNRNDFDMTQGRLVPQILRFAIPLALTSLLQLLYNAADVVVVGRFAGPDALAAVGSTLSLVNLIINLFIGLSVGTNVAVSLNYGAKDEKGVQDTVHTSILVAMIGGLGLGVFGFLLGGRFLGWMNTPPDVLPLATKYIRIYFIGMPVNMLTNFGAAILRAVGDTKRSLFYLSASGIINVFLNLFFVICCHMGVAGVAWATIVSQGISAVLVLRALICSEGYIHLDIRKLNIYREKLGFLLRLGVPAGFQEVCFSVSNVIIQSMINSFGAAVVAGDAASGSIEGLFGVTFSALHQANITFVSANFGAGKNSRLLRITGVCTLLVVILALCLGRVAILLQNTLLGIYATDPAVIAAGSIRLNIICSTNFLYGILSVMSGAMIGMGNSVIPMVVTVLGVCVLRVVWISLIPASMLTLSAVYYAYPVSWLVASVVMTLCVLKRKSRFPNEQHTI